MIKGHKICLKLIEKKDIMMLYRLSNEEKVRRYNIIPCNINYSNSNTQLRKALSIINEENILIGFITYKKCSYNERVYSIGITIGSRFWGMGYGQDSIRTLLRYLFTELNVLRVELEVIRTNLRAINCYKKCGFVEEGIKKTKAYIDKAYVDIIIMSILKNNVINI